jgi:hypothetical protein
MEGALSEEMSPELTAAVNNRFNIAAAYMAVTPVLCNIFQIVPAQYGPVLVFGGAAAVEPAEPDAKFTTCLFPYMWMGVWR